MKNKYLDWLVLMFSIICLIIMSGVFYNLSVSIDENNLSMSSILGGYTWQYLYWAMGVLNILIISTSIIKLKKN